jgi:hypothetical protein
LEPSNELADTYIPLSGSINGFSSTSRIIDYRVSAYAQLLQVIYGVEVFLTAFGTIFVAIYGEKTQLCNALAKPSGGEICK